MPSSTATVLPSPLLLPLPSLKLGRFLTSLQDPTQSYHDPRLPPATPILNPHLFSSHSSSSSELSFGSALTSLLSAKISRKSGLEVRVALARSEDYALDNSEEWFDRAVAEKATRRWIERAAERGRKIYLVVGYRTVTDARIWRRESGEKGLEGKLEVPAGLALAASGVILPGLGDVLDPGVEVGKSEKREEGVWFVAPGERICAVRYRKVKYGWLARKVGAEKGLRIEGETRRWSCIEGNLRGVYADEDDGSEDGEEEGEDIEVGFEEEFDVGDREGWERMETVEGDLYASI